MTSSEVLPPTFDELYQRKIADLVKFLAPFVDASDLLTFPKAAVLGLLVERGKVYEQEIAQGTYAALEPFLAAFDVTGSIREVVDKMDQKQRDHAAGFLRFFYHFAVEYLKKK